MQDAAPAPLTLKKIAIGPSAACRFPSSACLCFIPLPHTHTQSNVPWMDGIDGWIPLLFISQLQECNKGLQTPGNVPGNPPIAGYHYSLS